MSNVTVQTFNLPDWHWGGSTAKLRLYANTNWTDSGGTPHIGGTIGSPVGFYQEVSLTISGTTVTVPQFITQSTLDSLDFPTVRITGVLFDDQGARRETLFDNWFINTSTPTTWAGLRILNLGRGLVNPPDTYLTTIQTQALIDLAIGGFIPGGGAVNRVTKFVTSTTLGNSSITDDGVSVLLNPSSTMLLFAGSTASFPALKRSGTTLQVRLADDSAFAPLQASTLTLDGTLTLAATSLLSWDTRSNISSPANGNLLLRNAALSDFGLLLFGGSTSSFPALKRSSATLQVRLADDSAFGNLQLNNLTAGTSAALGQIELLPAINPVLRLWAGASAFDPSISFVGNNGTQQVILSGSSAGFIAAASNSIVRITNLTSTDFDRLQFGGSTSSFPALKRVTTTLHVKLADDSTFTGMQAAFQRASIFYFTDGSDTNLYSNSAGTIRLADSSGIDFNRLTFGGLSASYPSLKRSSTTLQVRLADDSAFAPFAAGTSTFTGALLPATHNTYDIGSSSFRWQNLQLQGLIVLGGVVQLAGQSSGVFTLFNETSSDFNRLQFGGTTSSFPAIKRSSTALETRLADDSAYAALNVLSLRIEAGQVLSFNGRSRLNSSADGVLNVTNAAGSTFSRLILGDTADSAAVSLVRGTSQLSIGDNAGAIAGITLRADVAHFNQILLNENTGVGSDVITIQAPSLSAGWTLTLPANDGSSGQFLQTDGNGITSWQTPAGGGGSVLFGMEMSGIGVVPGSTTYYSSFGFFSTGATTFNSTEANRQMAIPVAGTISNLMVTTESAQPGTGSLVFTIRKNSAGTSSTVTFASGAGAGNQFDNVNTVSVAAGDVIGIQAVNNASSNSAAIRYWACKFTPS